MDDKQLDEVIGKAQEFAEKTNCLMRGHLLSVTSQQDKKYCEAMADFAISLFQWKDVADGLPEVSGWYNVIWKHDYTSFDVWHFDKSESDVAYWREKFIGTMNWGWKDGITKQAMEKSYG